MTEGKAETYLARWSELTRAADEVGSARRRLETCESALAEADKALMQTVGPNAPIKGFHVDGHIVIVELGKPIRCLKESV